MTPRARAAAAPRHVAPAPLRDVIAALGAADAPYVLAPDRARILAAARPTTRRGSPATTSGGAAARSSTSARAGRPRVSTSTRTRTTRSSSVAKLFALLPPFAGHWRRDGARGDAVVEDLGRLRPRAMQRLFPIRDGWDRYSAPLRPARRRPPLRADGLGAVAAVRHPRRPSASLSRSASSRVPGGGHRADASGSSIPVLVMPVGEK